MNSVTFAGSKGFLRRSHHHSATNTVGNSRLVQSTCVRPKTHQQFVFVFNTHQQHVSSACRAATQDSGSLDDDDSTDSGDGMSKEDMAAFATRMNSMVASKPVMTGKQLRQLVFKKWGKTYDVRLQKIGGKMYLQVMWKFLEQKSFPLSEVEYMQQLDAVADYLTVWGVIDTVTSGIQSGYSRGPGYNHGGGAQCISVPLNVDLSGEFGADWR